MSFVSSKGNILCRLINIELHKIFPIINRAIKGLHCSTGPCLTTAAWRCHKNFSQWLKGLRQRQIAAVRQGPGPRFNIKMLFYQNRKSHCGNKTVVRSSYLHNGISYTGKMSSLYWIGTQDFIDDKSMLALVMTWWHQAIIWTNVDQVFMSPYGVTRGQWVNISDA